MQAFRLVKVLPLGEEMERIVNAQWEVIQHHMGGAPKKTKLESKAVFISFVSAALEEQPELQQAGGGA